MTPVSLKQETRQLIFKGVEEKEGEGVAATLALIDAIQFPIFHPAGLWSCSRERGNSAYINIESSSLVVVNGLSASGVTFIMGVKSAY